MNAVAVTEPDYGSDVAGVKVTAASVEGGWLINGVKTWVHLRPADVLMLLARTDPDRSRTHRVCPCSSSPRSAGDGHGFTQTRDNAHGGGKMEGRPIDTIGYRGMHSRRSLSRTGSCPREPDRRRGRPRPRVLPPDGRVRERTAADR